MQVKEIKFRSKGREIVTSVGLPESLEEAVQILGEFKCYDYLLTGLIHAAKTTAARKRQGIKKIIKLKTEALTAQQIAMLQEAGLID